MLTFAHEAALVEVRSPKGRLIAIKVDACNLIDRDSPFWLDHTRLTLINTVDLLAAFCNYNLQL